MGAAFLHEPRRMIVEEVPRPSAGPGQVRIAGYVRRNSGFTPGIGSSTIYHSGTRGLRGYRGDWGGDENLPPGRGPYGPGSGEPSACCIRSLKKVSLKMGG
jgi:hypothetical protein